MNTENLGLLSMTAEQYHSHSAVGHSGLVRIMRSPAHYMEYITNPPEPTAAMVMGAAFHAAILEPETFKSTFVAAPKFDRRTKEGKAAAEAWELANAGKTALPAEQFEAIQKMVENVMSHKGAANLLECGLPEKVAFWTDLETGIECKCRPDFLSIKGEAIAGIVDIKTCNDASADGFSRTIATLGYDVQAAFYQDGIKALTGRTVPFYFIAVEKEPPYAVACYEASAAMIEVGRDKYRGALQLLKWCQTEGRWPSYQPNGEVETINLPRWASKFSLEDDSTV